MNNYFNYYYYHDGYSSNDVNGYYPITIVKKDSNLLLTLPPSSPQQSLPSLKIGTWKDERLEHLDISKGLVEVLLKYYRPMVLQSKKY